MTFPLLSDPDSEIIRRFGLLNTKIDPDDHPWYGIPFPGSYIVDADGMVIAKFFEDNLGFRVSAAELMRAATGEELVLEPLPMSPEEVVVDVSFDGDHLHGGIFRDLIVRFAVPDGQHLYGEPVPDGMVATSVTIDDAEGLVVRPAILPPTTPHTLATGETLHIFEGEVLIRVPITQLSRSLTKVDDGWIQRITGTLRWQCCDDEACGLPQTRPFSIDVPASPHDDPTRPRPDGMDVATHFTKMIERRTTELTIADVFAKVDGPPE